MKVDFKWSTLIPNGRAQSGLLPNRSVVRIPGSKSAVYTVRTNKQHIVLHCTVLYCTTLYFTVLYYTVLYCTIRSVFKISCLLLWPRPWQFEI